MRNEIVVGLESSSGMAALQWAAAEATRSHAVLRAVHALSWPFGVEHADGVLASCPVVVVPRTLAANVAQNPRPVLDHTTTLASA